MPCFFPLQVTTRGGYLPQFPTSCLLAHRANFILTRGSSSLICLRSGSGDLGHTACHRVTMTEVVAAGSIKAEDIVQFLCLVQSGRCLLRGKGSRNTGSQGLLSTVAQYLLFPVLLRFWSRHVWQVKMVRATRSKRMANAKIPYFQVLKKGICKLCKLSITELFCIMSCSSEREREGRAQCC